MRSGRGKKLFAMCCGCYGSWSTPRGGGPAKLIVSLRPNCEKHNGRHMAGRVYCGFPNASDTTVPKQVGLAALDLMDVVFALLPWPRLIEHDLRFHQRSCIILRMGEVDVLRTLASPWCGRACDGDLIEVHTAHPLASAI